MKKHTLLLLPLLAFLLVSCDGKISPESANAFKGEYWMESTAIGIVNGTEEPLSSSSTWTPVSIYEKGGKLYVQTEWFGAPYTGEHPEEIEGTRERPDFILQRRVSAEEGDEEPGEGEGIENVEVTNAAGIVVVNGCIIAINRGVKAKSLPIKVKSGSETVLNLEPYEKVIVSLTDAEGNEIQKIHAWYEYGPMVKKGETISWEVEFKDDFTPPSDQGAYYERIFHRNTLYKK